MTRIGSLAAVVLLLIASAHNALAQGRGGGTRAAAGCSLATPLQFHECAVPKMKTFDPPRTPDGKPDFQGYWNRVFTSQDLEDHGSDGLNTQAGPSLVIDTPDHKIPYQPWALEFRKYGIHLALPFPDFEKHVRVSIGTPAAMREFWAIWDLRPERHTSM